MSLTLAVPVVLEELLLDDEDDDDGFAALDALLLDEEDEEDDEDDDDEEEEEEDDDDDDEDKEALPSLKTRISPALNSALADKAREVLVPSLVAAAGALPERLASLHKVNAW